jgi:hypothetical protein
VTCKDCPQNAKPVFWLILSLVIVFALNGCTSGAGQTGADQKTTISPSAQFTNTLTPTPLPSATPSATPTHTPSPTFTPTSTDTPSPTPTLLGNADGVLLSTCNDRFCLNGRIYRLDLNTGEVLTLGEIGDKLQDVSSEGRILYSNAGSLYVRDAAGADPQKIADNFDHGTQTNAYWRTANEIVYVSTEGMEAIYRQTLDGSAPQKIIDQKQILKLFPAADNEGIFWEEGYQTGGGYYNLQTWWSNITGGEHVKVDDNAYNLSFSRSGHLVAYVTGWIKMQPDDPYIAMISTTNGSHQFETMGSVSSQNLFTQHLISPDQEKVLVEEVVCSPVCEAGAHYLIAPDGSLITELPEEIGEIANGNWSPDSQLFFYQPNTRYGLGEQRKIVLLNLNTLQLTTFDGEFLGKDWLIEILWIPH